MAPKRYLPRNLGSKRAHRLAGNSRPKRSLAQVARQVIILQRLVNNLKYKVRARKMKRRHEASAAIALSRNSGSKRVSHATNRWGYLRRRD